MKLQDTIMIVENAIDLRFCENIIKRYETSSLTKARQNDVQCFTELNFNEAEWNEEIQYVISIIRTAYMDFYRKNFPEYALPKEWAYEEVRMKRYREGIGSFKPHVDVGDYASARRFLVAFFYLNDVEEGGETKFHFDDMPLSVRPKAGTLIMFPPTWQYPHSGEMPISGNKYILGTYLHYI